VIVLPEVELVESRSAVAKRIPADKPVVSMRVEKTGVRENRSTLSSEEHVCRRA